MIKRILTSVALLSSLSSIAQELPYTFTVENGPYTELANPTSLNDGMIWDDPQYIVPIGFDFEYMGSIYNTLSFGGVTSYGGELVFGNINDLTVWDNIMPYAMDLMDGGFDTPEMISQSDISYEVIGAPGARIFKLQWKNAAFYNDEAPYTMRMNFQMWLYEYSNNIEFWYGARENLDTFVIQDLNGILVGMGQQVDLTNQTNPTAENFWVLTGDPLNPGVANTPSVVDIESTTLLLNTPPAGYVYAFRTGIASIDEVVNNELVAELYPTQVYTSFNVKTAEHQKVQLTIMDATGKIVDSQLIDGGFQVINAEALASGAYFVKMSSDAGTTVKRFVKK